VEGTAGVKFFKKAATIAEIAHIRLEQTDYDVYLAKGVERYKVPYYVEYKILCHMCPLGYCDKLNPIKAHVSPKVKTEWDQRSAKVHENLAHTSAKCQASCKDCAASCLRSVL